MPAFPTRHHAGAELGRPGARLAILLAGLVFWRAPRDTPKAPHEAPPGLWAGAAVLVVLALVLALVPGAAFQPLVDAGQGAILGPESLAEAVHGVDGHGSDGHGSDGHGADGHGTEHGSGLWAKLLAWGLGALLVWGRGALLRPLPKLETLGRFGPNAAFDAALAGLRTVAYLSTRVLQSGYLRMYLFSVLLAALVLAGYPLFVDRAPLPPFGGFDIKLHEVVIMLTMLLSAAFVARTDSRLSAVVALGVVGIGVALHYMILGGPDLAMTQLSIETLSVVLFVYVLHRLPRFAHFTTAAERRRDLVLSLIVGMFFTSILWALASAGGGSLLSPYFAEQSYPEGKGRNVVNVILVDFRGLDTMGEITVLSVAAMGVYGLLRLRVAGPPSVGSEGRRS